MQTVDQIISRLNELGDPEAVAFKQKKFGVISNNALGVFMKDLNILTREIGRNSEIAEALFDTGIYEARILCSKLFKPKDLTFSQVVKWTETFENWEICDSFSMGVYAKSSLAQEVIKLYKTKNSEFEKRTAFATMSAYCMADKKAVNEIYTTFFPDIIAASSDDRTYVKKAVNWALRSIGKRNIDLNKEALAVASKIANIDSKAARWIASNAIKELSNPNVRMSDYPRTNYRPQSN